MKKQVVASVVAFVLAALGVLALVSYARGANDRAFDDARLVEVLQVQSDVPAGTPASRLADSVELVEVPAVVRLDGALTSLDKVSKLSTNTFLKKGDQLVVERFGDGGKVSSTGVPEGYQEISFSIDAPRALGGELKVGDRIGILASYGSTTNFLAQQVQVTRVSNGVVAATNGNAVLVTVAVKTLDAEKIANVFEFGKAWLTLQNESTDTEDASPITPRDVVG